MYLERRSINKRAPIIIVERKREINQIITIIYTIN